MSGKLFGISTGPGDPELLTLKAVSTIEKCPIIAVPAHEGEARTALKIVEQYIQNKQIIECHFAMSPDMSKRIDARQQAADEIAHHLDSGHDVGFITLGDATTYSTYMYVHDIIKSRGYETEIIPGVTSYAAAAAALGIALCSGDEALTVIPARHSLDIGELLGYAGNKVIMKSGENLLAVLKQLQVLQPDAATYVVSRASMDGEALYFDSESFAQSGEQGYFTVAIVKESGQ